MGSRNESSSCDQYLIPLALSKNTMENLLKAVTNIDKSENPCPCDQKIKQILEFYNFVLLLHKLCYSSDFYVQFNEPVLLFQKCVIKIVTNKRCSLQNINCLTKIKIIYLHHFKGTRSGHLKQSLRAKFFSMKFMYQTHFLENTM